MKRSRRPRFLIDIDNCHEQQQSPLFTALPLDIRRHIYLQLWLDYGTTQHIFLFGANSCLMHFPCLLKKGTVIQLGSRSSTPLEPEGHSEAAAETEAQVSEDATEVEPYDDPGDIDDAIQDMLSAPQSQIGSAAGLDGSGNDVHNRVNSSQSCMHEKCFVAYMETYDMAFERAYSRNYRRATYAAFSVVGIMKPLFVCKKMYMEAGESLYSKMAFSFSDVSAFERFMDEVPRALTDRIPAVDIITIIPIDGADVSWETRSPFIQDTSLSSLDTFCTKLGSVLSNVQELRLCIHLTASLRQHAPRQLPGKDWFEPLYRLSGELSQHKLRELDIKLVTRCDQENTGGQEESVTYGSTPKFLKDAPFRAILVPRGWHADSECCAYWVDQNGGQTDGT